MFTKNDLIQIQSKGISLENIEKQIENFKKGFPFIKLINPATVHNGIKKFTKQEAAQLSEYYSKESKNSRVLKFVPASGAASRMFKHLFAFMKNYKGTEQDYNDFIKDKSFNSVYHFFADIKKFAFYDDLKLTMQNNNLDVNQCIDDKDFVTIIDYLLTEKGMNYARLPKGLLKFHKYKDSSRMSVEEHLIEGANYCKDKNNRVAIHFTVSPEHKQIFIEKINHIKNKYERMFNLNYDISFSIQKSSTDTIAVDLNNEPFREQDGSLLFRPGGHGALIENLNDIKGDIIFIKNIDNVVPDRLKPQTYLYKKVIGGYLIKLQKRTHEYLKLLENMDVDDKKIDEIIKFSENELYIKHNSNFNELSKSDKINYLFKKLNRPMRVCGMVENEGEPGGGPFWIKNSYDEMSLQIVESSQIDFKNPQQNEIVHKSTHFNPVDLVCGICNYKGDFFNLNNFIDNSTGFISIKSKDGKSLKAQELPGLWNGAMAKWITVFVEVPLITFNPVKTINDLLRKEHQ